MGFFDRFKSQPRWKHADPAVRIAAVDAMPDDDQDLLAQIAREDEDAGVRRAAVAKLTDPATLAAIARGEQDESVRGVARDLVIALAQDATDEAVARQALDGITEARDVVVVARSAELEAVARAALDRLSDGRLLATVARQATHASVRLAALERLSDPADVLTVAIKTEHRDVGLLAVERIGVDRDALETVAVRARSKVVQRRARAAAHALVESEAPPALPQPAAVRRLQLCDVIDALARSSDLSRAGERLEAVDHEWSALSGEADAAVATRYARGVEQLRSLLARSDEERAAHEHRMRAMADELEQATTGRLGLCERVEALEGPDAAASLDEARTVWVALAPWPETARETTTARQLEERFQRAVADCERRLARAAEQQAALGHFEQVLATAEAAVADGAFADVRGLWARVQRGWKEAGGATAPPDLVARYRVVEASVAAREQQWREARAREQEELLARMSLICEQAEKLASGADVALKNADRLQRDLRAALGHTQAVYPRRLGEEMAERLRQAQALLLPKLQELRESEEWRRWANAGVQEELCREAETVRDIADPAEAARKVRDLQARWKKVGPAPRERSDELWNRFKAAIDENRPRLDEHFSQSRQAEAANVAVKEALVARAEALADSTEWIATSEELKRLQAEWQQSGPAPREQGQVLWHRFRAACDRFFTRRKDDLAQRKHAWTENLQRKEALCQQAEALADTTDWDQGVAEVRRLQAEWRTIGPVKKNKSEAVWQRFRAACDAFFERYRHRDQLGLASNVSERERVCADLEALAGTSAGDGSAPTGDALRERVLDVWRQWKGAPRVPRQLVEPLEQRFEAALMQVVAQSPEAFRGSRLDVEANRRRMEQLCVQVESFLQGRVTTSELAATPAATLATMLKDALAANTIGGRVDEEAKWRAATAAVREAQQAWLRLGPVPGDDGRQLAARFQRASRRFFELRVPAGTSLAGPRS